jgi:PPE-repeat protein
VLVATNFFGINTIPLALNEGDYVRMWIQAATTMSIYEAVSGTAVASTPQTTPAPVVLNPISTWLDSVASAIHTVEQVIQDASSLNLSDLQSSLLNVIQNFSIAAFIQDPVGYTQQIVETFVGQFPLLSDLYFGFGGDHLFEFLANPVGFVENIINKFLADPLLVLTNPFLLVLSPDDFPSIAYSVLSPFIPLAAPVGAVGGFAGLAGLAGLPQLAVAPTVAPVAAAPAVLPVTGMAPPAVASAVTPATAPAPGTAPAPAPTASTVASSAPPPAPPAAGGAGFVPPYAVGPPGIGFGSGLSASASSSAKRKAPQPDTAVAAAAAAAREHARARRRLRAKQRGYGDEFMDMDVEVDPDWGAPPGAERVTSTVASDRGAETQGFAGTVSKVSAQPTGLTTLPGDEFGGGPRMPMLPNTWDHESREGGQQRS